jgi:5'-3' exonuclease
MSESRLLLFDTASLYFRAFHGLPTSLRSPSGHPVNAVRGLLDFLARFITEYSPTQVACCWDVAWRPAWRVQLVGSYKAHRLDSGDVEQVPEELAAQVPLITETLATLGLAVLGAADHEADDVIGTLAATHRHCDVVTGDRDLFQVVDDDRSVRVLYLGRGVSKHERVDAAWVRQRYGISPSQYIDFAVLRGDPSDGLPGIAGIGEKTAAALLTDHRDLSGILSAAEAGVLSPRLTKSLTGSLDYLAAARPVVAVATDLALPGADLTLWNTPPDPARFAQLSEELGLGRSAERITQALTVTGQARRT